MGIKSNEIGLLLIAALVGLSPLVVACEKKQVSVVSNQKENAQSDIQGNSIVTTTDINAIWYDAKYTQQMGLEIAQFSKEWSRFTVFDEDTINIEQLEYMGKHDLRFRIDNDKRSFIAGVYQKSESDFGNFVAIIRTNDAVEKVYEISKQRKMLVFKEIGNKVYVGNRFEGEFIAFISLDNIFKMTVLIGG